MAIKLELGTPAWDGEGLSRAYRGEGFRGSIGSSLEGHISVTFLGEGDEPKAVGEPDSRTATPEAAEQIVLDDEAASQTIGNVLADLHVLAGSAGSS